MNSMQSIQVRLEDWQSAALASLARAGGEDMEAMVQRLLAEQIAQRAEAAFESFVSGGFQRRRAATIEQRLQTLFAE